LAEFSPVLEEVTRQRRPGGRTADVTRRINEAVLSLLVEGGIDACTFQNVAARAGIERSTLYRRNPDRWPTIVDALVDYVSGELGFADTGSFKGNLRALLHSVRSLFAGPMGPPILAVAAALQGGVAPGQLERAWTSRLLQLAPFFEAAFDRGELPPEVDQDMLLAMASGPIVFSALLIGRPADDATIDGIVDLVCQRYCLKR